MSARKLSCISVVLFILYMLQRNCSLADIDIDIKCIPLKLCPMAMKLVKTRAFAPETIAFLRFTHCGFSGGEPKVWCNLFTYCTTPDSRRGTCKNIKECESFLEYMGNVDRSDAVVKKYLREFRCSTEFDPQIKVCCPEEQKYSTPAVSSEDVSERWSSGDEFPDPDLGTCGQQSIDNKIVGGSETYLNEFPWVALFKYASNGQIKYACSGNLINERYVVTAAHCVDPDIIKEKKLGKLISVVLGEYDVRNDTDCVYQKYGNDCADPPQEIRPDSYRIHPAFNSTSMLNDIAIIRLSYKARYSDYVQPICLPPKDLRMQGNETFTICGWGKTEIEKRSSVKRKATLKLADDAKCNVYNRRNLSEGQICAGSGNGIDSCYGDSGGPLMLDKNVKNGLVTFLIGIVSYGYGQVCGVYPGVYTYIPTYLQWIRENTR